MLPYPGITPRQNHSNKIMIRLIRKQQMVSELRMMYALNEEMGIPALQSYFERIISEDWVGRNDEMYHLYEADGQLKGYTGLVPIYKDSYLSFSRGERFAFFDATTSDILTVAEYRRAQQDGVYIWVESLCYVNDTALDELRRFIYAFLSRIYLLGLVVTTSRSEDEEICAWWGLTLQGTYGECPTGVRKLWYADLDTIEASDAGILGSSAFVRSIFWNVRGEFTAVPIGTKLSETERRIARLYFCQNLKRRDVARVLSMNELTVKSHLQRIRKKASNSGLEPTRNDIRDWILECTDDACDQD